MNVQEYISSGIIESYVFGLASKEEQAEFEQMCIDHSEIKAARETFELLLEKQAVEAAIAPPAHLKHKIFSTLAIDQPASEFLAATTKAPVVKMGLFRAVAAASVILLVGSTALNIYFFSQYKDYSSRYDQLVASQTQLAANNHTLQTKLEDYESAINMIKDPAMTIVKMPGVATSPDPSSLATVYWDTRSKDVYLLVNSLPQPATDKEYQLWALVDGKPVDAGVFEIKLGQEFVKMKNIPKAQAFAITLEKHGGSEAPTMQALYVLGKVS